MTLCTKEGSGIHWSSNEGHLCIVKSICVDHTPIHALRGILSLQKFMTPIHPFPNNEFPTVCCIESARMLGRLRMSLMQQGCSWLVQNAQIFCHGIIGADFLSQMVFGWWVLVKSFLSYEWITPWGAQPGFHYCRVAQIPCEMQTTVKCPLLIIWKLTGQASDPTKP